MIKKFLIITLVAFLLITSAKADKSPDYQEIKQSDIDAFQERKNKCDIDFEKQANASITTADMKESNYTAADCYTAIINDIIDKYYKGNAKEQKEALTNYIKASYDAYADIYTNLDFCRPRCGTMYIVTYGTEVAHLIKELTQKYINLLFLEV